ncbi:MAG: prepilin-type N-terminal cleavage/methylation domain-containing protein, partial [Gammaproteobacteria bacterium]|nr:prepilin-type N-terminal cleavage/methylation domain-containing protein [Gammaproteobacteria bacterium]
MKKQNTQGFTLVEILIALVLLSVVAVGFTRFQSSNLSDSVISNQRTQASTIAQQQLEQLRSLASSQGTANFIDNLDTESPDNQFVA